MKDDTLLDGAGCRRLVSMSILRDRRLTNPDDREVDPVDHSIAATSPGQGSKRYMEPS